MINNKWVLIILIFPYLNISFFELEILRPVIFAWQFLVIFIAAAIVWLELNRYIVLTLTFLLAIILSAIIHNNLSPGFLFNIGTLLSFIIYISFLLKRPNDLIKGLFYLLTTLVIFNFLTIILGGITIINAETTYLLGGKNHIAYTVIIQMLVSYLYSHFKYGKIIRPIYILIFIGVLSLFLVKSGTGIIIGLLIILFLFVPKKVYLSYNFYILIFLIANFLIVIYRIQERMFGNFIQNVLGKGLTLSGRTYVWDFVLYQLQDSWFLGLGRGNNIIYNNFYTISEAHNGLLSIALDAGIIGIILFFIILLTIGKKLKQYKYHLLYSVISFAIFLFTINSITENIFLLEEFWLTLVFASKIDRLVNIE